MKKLFLSSIFFTALAHAGSCHQTALSTLISPDINSESSVNSYATQQFYLLQQVAIQSLEARIGTLQSIPINVGTEQGGTQTIQMSWASFFVSLSTKLAESKHFGADTIYLTDAILSNEKNTKVANSKKATILLASNGCRRDIWENVKILVDSAEAEGTLKVFLSRAAKYIASGNPQVTDDGSKVYDLSVTPLSQLPPI